MDAGTEAGDRGGEPGFGADADRGRAKYAISSGLLYSWRQQVLGGHVSVVTGPAPSFARVELAPALQAPDGSEPVSPAVPAPPSGPDGVIEIVLRSGVLVRVDAAVDGRALRRVLSALDD